MKQIIIIIFCILLAGTLKAQKKTLLLNKTELLVKYPSPKYTHTGQTLTRESVKNGANRIETIVIGQRLTTQGYYDERGWAQTNRMYWDGIVYSKTVIEKDGFFSNYDENDFYAMVLPMINEFGKGDTESNGTIIQRSWRNSVWEKGYHSWESRLESGWYTLRMTFDKRSATITVEIDFR